MHAPMPLPAPGSLSLDIELRLLLSGDRSAPVPCRLSYSADEPYELRAAFLTAEGPVTWVFARDLVRSGLVNPVGQGDVVVWPSRGRGTDVVCLALSSPSGQALLEADRSVVAGFLDRTDALVPPGTESDRLDLDTLVDQLLEHRAG